MYEYTTSEPVTTSVRLPGGSCTVTAREVSGVSVQVTPLEQDRKADREAADGTTVEFRGGLLTVRTPKSGPGRLLGLSGGRVRLEIGLPSGSSLTFGTDSAGLEVHGRLSELKVDNGSGDVRAEHITGDVSINSSSGRIQLRRAGGAVVLDTGSGDLEIGHASGPVRSTSSSGDTVLGTSETDVDFESGSGDLRITTARGGIVRASTSSGRVEVGVEPGVGVLRQRLKTSSGARRGDLIDGAPTPTGNRTLTLDISTTAGDIEVSSSALDHA